MIRPVAADSIGTRIRLRRQQLRLTQEELARRVGVDPSTIVNWEKDRHFPVRYQGALEAELGISLTNGEESLEIPADLQEYIDGLTDKQREYFIDRLRAGQELRRSRSQDRRRSAG